MYDFGGGAVAGSTEAGGDEDLTAHGIQIIGKNSKNY